MADTKTDTRFHDPRLVELYKLVAMRFWERFIEARDTVELYGGGILTEEDLGGRPYDADNKYAAAAESALCENPQNAKEALAFVQFAGVLAADRLIGEVMQEYVNDARDAFQQSKALAAVADFLNGKAIEETVEEDRKRMQERLGGARL